MIGTSPPKQKLSASVTLSIRVVATAASMALPPDFRSSNPASAAGLVPAATAPPVPDACQSPGLPATTAEPQPTNINARQRAVESNVVVGILMGSSDVGRV